MSAATSRLCDTRTGKLSPCHPYLVLRHSRALVSCCPEHSLGQKNMAAPGLLLLNFLSSRFVFVDFALCALHFLSSGDQDASVSRPIRKADSRLLWGRPCLLSTPVCLINHDTSMWPTLKRNHLYLRTWC